MGSLGEKEKKGILAERTYGMKDPKLLPEMLGVQFCEKEGRNSSTRYLVSDTISRKCRGQAGEKGDTGTKGGRTATPREGMEGSSAGPQRILGFTQADQKRGHGDISARSFYTG